MSDGPFLKDRTFTVNVIGCNKLLQTVHPNNHNEQTVNVYSILVKM